MEERRPSWPYPIILVGYLVVLIITPWVGKWVGGLLFATLLCVSLWAALSVRQFRALQRNYPNLERGEYVFNMLFFPVLVPLLLVIGWWLLNHDW